MATIADPEEAKSTPCTCYKIDIDGPEEPENLMCWTKGAFGTLTNPQDSEFCTDWKVKYSSEMSEHLKKFSIIGDIMDVCLEEENEGNFLECVDFEAERLMRE